jgi:antitoxin (DNA-binding transcriptional repressor) of toxin-antitoxin stability system
MKSLSIRETRAALPELERLLARHGAIAIRRRGKVIARIEPAGAAPSWPALDAFRAGQRRQRVPSQVLVRRDRDGR